MKTIRKIFIYGFLVWLLPFIFSVLIFFLHDKDRALFESLMSVFGIFTAVLFTVLYFKNTDKNLKMGIILGIVWALISLFFDLLFFVAGPVKMAMVDYIKDIGVSYLAMPIITIGISVNLKLKKEAQDYSS